MFFQSGKGKKNFFLKKEITVFYKNKKIQIIHIFFPPPFKIRRETETEIVRGRKNERKGETVEEV
mgnify:CR=1 FL=1